MSPEMQFLLFYGNAALVLIPAFGVVTSRNIIHAALWLALCLVGVAGVFFALGAEFLAAIQVLLYAGGIVVLLLFAVMLTRGVADEGARVVNRQAPCAVLACGVLAVVLIYVVTGQYWPRVGFPPGTDGTAANLADALLSPYVLPFEAASVLLLAAIIGAIVIARADRE